MLGYSKYRQERSQLEGSGHLKVGSATGGIMPKTQQIVEKAYIARSLVMGQLFRFVR
jgi:hypothetical protein